MVIRDNQLHVAEAHTSRIGQFGRTLQFAGDRSAIAFLQ